MGSCFCRFSKLIFLISQIFFDNNCFDIMFSVLLVSNHVLMA